MIDLSDYKCPQQARSELRRSWRARVGVIEVCGKASSACSIVGVAGERTVPMLQLERRLFDREMGNLLQVRLETPYWAQLVIASSGSVGERGETRRDKRRIVAGQLERPAQWCSGWRYSRRRRQDLGEAGDSAGRNVGQGLGRGGRREGRDGGEGSDKGSGEHGVRVRSFKVRIIGKRRESERAELAAKKRSEPFEVDRSPQALRLPHPGQLHTVPVDERKTASTARGQRVLLTGQPLTRPL